MANKMLIDATHPEETRVVVLRGNRVEEFDFESAHRKQLRGNIYLAKVTRVEPSLQAAFVDYGGNRHGFLAFSEIHPDYYQIPVADRQALIDEEERAQRAADDEADRRSSRRRNHHRPHARTDDAVHADVAEPHDGEAQRDDHEHSGEPESGQFSLAEGGETLSAAPSDEPETATETAAAREEVEPSDSAHVEPAAELVPPEGPHEQPGEYHSEDDSEPETAIDAPAPEGGEAEHAAGDAEATIVPAVTSDEKHGDDGEHEENGEEEEIVESVGGADALEEVPDRAPRYRRQYKIQEVIKRRQVMLVQVVKEERGTKGAALTTYLSLAGRYSVLMPNTARGGGISRKITNSEDRARLKEAAAELEVPEGMGVILRTAGASRTKTEIKRDFEYLLRMWETVRDLTLKSTAPKLVYEEGSLVKRSIRDLYSKDIDEVVVAGADAYAEAKDFMRMLMPGHAKNVKPYADTQPLLSRYGVESQLDAMFSPVVQLRSGGYIVINQTEALVAIDVNSGRATREHHIEDTALKTNLEASDEISRQLRLRDMAGLIVIDFIDMDEKRNNRSVERRLKECLKQDRARIQVGRISHFGLLEMSRQRIRTSVLESSTEKCPYCGGSGHVRSVSSLALQVLRALEEQLMKGGMHNLIARTRPDVALYVLNQKRAHLRSLEERFAITITVTADESVTAPQAFVIDRGEQVHSLEAAKAIAEQAQATAAPLEEEDDLEDAGVIEDEETEDEAEATEASAAPERGENGPRRRRRRRGRRGGRDNAERQPRPEGAADHPEAFSADADDEAGADDEIGDAQGDFAPGETAEGNAGEGVADTNGRGERDGNGERDGERRRRRRGRRGGRRNRQDHNGDFAHTSEGEAQPHHEYAEAEEIASPLHSEPELKDAVAALDAPPAPEPVHEETAAHSPPPLAAEPEAPRRRSTVREPAPFAQSEDAPHAVSQPAAPASEPVITEAGETENASQPRRTGWWSRRFAGG
jgi:ribonuclease E